jgi:hypothetical protein
MNLIEVGIICRELFFGASALTSLVARQSDRAERPLQSVCDLQDLFCGYDPSLGLALAKPVVKPLGPHFGGENDGAGASETGPGLHPGSGGDPVNLGKNSCHWINLADLVAAIALIGHHQADLPQVRVWTPLRMQEDFRDVMVRRFRCFRVSGLIDAAVHVAAGLYGDRGSSPSRHGALKALGR